MAISHFTTFYFPLPMARHQFKARPINPEVFTRGGMYGVKQVADVGVTEAKTPNLATKRRQEQRRARDEEEEGEGGEEGGESFHAKPMPNFEKLQVCMCSNVRIYIHMYLETTPTCLDL